METALPPKADGGESKGKAKSATSTASKVPEPVKGKRKPFLPWVERHRPQHLGQVVGNTDQVRKIAEWLRDWDDVVLRGQTKEVVKEEWRKFGPATPDNINARAVLVSGPPGIGKTTTCTLVARCNPRYRLMEFNASDARSKATVDHMTSTLAGGRTLNMSGKGGALERAVIIMDECDGMAGGGDKGGMQALINMIKVTKNPIICICNDRNDRDVRLLAQVCYDIKFKKPENSLLAKRIKHILEGEGRSVAINMIEAIIDGCGQDIRQVINQVQFFGSGTAKGSQKDVQNMLSPFEACMRLLSGGDKGGRCMKMDKKQELLYIDADLMPLMIQENYLHASVGRRDTPKSGEAPEEDALDRCAKAAELIALADSIGSDFSLAGDAGTIGTLYLAFLAASDEPFPKPAFPQWLMKRSTITKSARMAGEVHARIKSRTSTSLHDLTTSNYHELLHRRLLKPLQTGQVKECAVSLFYYGLTRDFFTEQAPALRGPLGLEDGYKKLEGQAKTKLMVELQELVKAAAPAVKRKREEGGGAVGNAFTKKRGGKKAAAEEDADMEGDGGDDAGPGASGKKKGVKKDAKNKASSSYVNPAVTLSGWRVQVEGSGDDVDTGPKDPVLILKYIDGHTCAVRRRVKMCELLTPWMGF